MDYFVYHKEGSQLTKLSESGLETPKNAAVAGVHIRGVWRKKMEDRRCGQATETSFI